MSEKLLSETIVNKVSKDGRFANNLMFHLLDAIETLQEVSEGEGKLMGVGFGGKVKQYLTQIKWVTKDLLRYIRKTDMESQENFAEDAENTIKLLVLTGDRVGNKPENMQKIFDFIEAMPSEEGIHLNKFYKEYKK